MAKKKTAEASPATPATPPRVGGRGRSTGVSAAIRSALVALGTSATAAEVKTHIQTNSPTINADTSSFPSALSNMRRKLRSEAAGGVVVPANSPATVENLLAVNTAAAEAGGLDNLKKTVDDVMDLVAKVGGTHRLIECIKALGTVRN